jgi:CHAD domain-containing protein
VCSWRVAIALQKQRAPTSSRQPEAICSLLISNRCFIFQFTFMTVLSKAGKEEFDSPVERLLASIANLRQQPTSKGAHFYRTSVRRFEAWADVFHPHEDAPQKQALKFLKKLRKATGKFRDAEVHLELLEKLRAGGAHDKKKLENALKSRRDRYRSKLDSLLRDPILSSIWRTLRVLDEVPPQSTQPTISNPIKGMARLALNQYRAFVQRRAELSPENLHQYRLECKRFRYTAELAGNLPAAQKLVDSWKKVQDLIGDWHDYLMLAELAGDLVGNSTLHEALVRHRDAKYDEAVREVAIAEVQLLQRDKASAKKQPQRETFSRAKSGVA